MKTLRLSSAILALLLTGISTSGQFTGVSHRKIFPGGPARPTAFTYIAASVTGCWNGNGSTNCAYNLHVNPTAGHLGVIAAEWESSTATASFACTNNGSWTAIGSPKVGVGANASFRGQMFYVASLVAGAAPENCTLTISTSVAFLFWEYAEYSYTGTLSSLDGTPQYSNAPAVASIATISGVTTAGSSDLIFSACIGVANTCSAGSGYTARNDTNGCRNPLGAGNCNSGTTGTDMNGTIGSLLEEKVNVGAGAQTATFGTTTATDDVILGLVAF